MNCDFDRTGNRLFTNELHQLSWTHQTSGFQSSYRNITGDQLKGLTDVHRTIGNRVGEIAETTFGNAHPEGLLAAFKHRTAILAAGTRAFTLATTATGLTQPAAQTTSNTTTLLTTRISGQKFVKAHRITPRSSWYCSLVRSWDNASSVARIRFTGL